MTDYKLEPKGIVDELAQFIRQVDGSNRMGAGALAEKICEQFHVDAPAVQGEPVGSGWMLFPKAAWDFLCGTGELNGFGFGDRPMGQPPFWWRLVIRKMLDSAPQPAGQQPEPISRNLRAVHAMILSALDRDASDGKAVRGEMAAELRSALSEKQPAACVGCEGAPGSDNSPCAVCGQQSAPDVAALMRALEEIIHPVRFMQERLEEGERLNGMAAVQLAEDASYLRGIAIAARAEVNRMQFGTDEWEAAMEKVRELVEAENAATDFGRHASIDGDIWSV